MPGAVRALAPSDPTVAGTVSPAVARISVRKDKEFAQLAEKGNGRESQSFSFQWHQLVRGSFGSQILGDIHQHAEVVFDHEMRQLPPPCFAWYFWWYSSAV